MRLFLLASVLLAGSALASPGASADPAYFTAPLPDPALAEITGKFLLPDGTSIALAVTTDTRIDGQLLLRSVLTVDNAATLKVFGASGGEAPSGSTSASSSTAPAGLTPSGVNVLFDRQSGMRTVTPTYAMAPAVSVNTGGAPGASADAAQPNLVPLALTPGGPAVEAPGGLVSLAASGHRVNLIGDRIDVTHMLGPALATAIANTANDRTIDTVVGVDVDVARATSFAAGSSALRASDLALDVTRALIR